MKPEEYYQPQDAPDSASKTKMWRAIEKEIAPHRFSLFVINDTRSFVYGMAAAFVLYLSTVGAFTLIKQSIENGQPSVVQVDKAYQSAIHEFEKVVPRATSSVQSPQTSDVLLARKDQLKLLEIAINDLKSETPNIDLSPLKRMKLRQLYSLKLQILQQMIENGEIEL
ncbi:MAG: hypothetical protein HY276_11670 [Ignavibacteriales bacterium]|nr:hypothetical protein [Ignavibacteriales bacterium]MBI3788896.1 hypothetical protein [Ignavibacteriales bacterium]